MPNVKFNYCYRDAGNYKNYGFVVFNNVAEYSLAYVMGAIQTKLIDQTWFYANQWQLPALYFPEIDLNSDPSWHEFMGIELTDEPANAALDDFLKLI